MLFLRTFEIKRCTHLYLPTNYPFSHTHKKIGCMVVQVLPNLVHLIVILFVLHTKKKEKREYIKKKHYFSCFNDHRAISSYIFIFFNYHVIEVNYLSI